MCPLRIYLIAVNIGNTELLFEICSFLTTRTPEQHQNVALVPLLLKVHWCVEDFTLKHLLLFGICAREISEKFVYKHLETIEYVKN